MISRKRKPHEPREVKRAKTIKWELEGINYWKVSVDGYELRVEQFSEDDWSWHVKLPELNMTLNGGANSVHSAKNKAVYRMNKHKKSLIRKMVNHAS